MQSIISPASQIGEGTPPYWELLPNGICFITRAPVRGPAIKFLRFATGQVEHVTELPRWPHSLAVSPDGRWILSEQVDKYESDLMLVEGFR